MSRHARDRGNAQTTTPEEDVAIHTAAQVEVSGWHRGLADNLLISSDSAGLGQEGMRCAADLPPVVETGDEEEAELAPYRLVTVGISRPDG